MNILHEYIRGIYECIEAEIIEWIVESSQKLVN